MKQWAKAAVQGAACGLMFGAVLLIGGWLWWPQVAAAQGKQPGVAEVVKARRFEVVDAAGKVRARLSVGPTGPSLDLYDGSGNERASLFAVPDGSPGLDLHDAAGKARAGLAVFSDGRPFLGLSDAAGKQRAVLSVSPDGGADLELSDAAEKLRVLLSVLPDGSPFLGMSDAAGGAAGGPERAL